MVFTILMISVRQDEDRMILRCLKHAKSGLAYVLTWICLWYPYSGRRLAVALEVEIALKQASAPGASASTFRLQAVLWI